MIWRSSYTINIDDAKVKKEMQSRLILDWALKWLFIEFLRGLGKSRRFHACSFKIPLWVFAVDESAVHTTLFSVNYLSVQESVMWAYSLSWRIAGLVHAREQWLTCQGSPMWFRSQLSPHGNVPCDLLHPTEAQQIFQECLSEKISFCKKKVCFQKVRFVRPAEAACSWTLFLKIVHLTEPVLLFAV